MTINASAIAWVEISVPDSITTPEGVVFRPNLLATTSFDGSIATTFKRTITDVVCDNTWACALAETGQQYRVKHTRNFGAQLAPARQALVMVHTTADEFSAEVAQLCATAVTGTQWDQFVDLTTPTTDTDRRALTGQALTLANTKRHTLNRLYQDDPRVAPWVGTAHGVLQAVNTYEHYEGTVRGASRAERNMLCTITGDYTQLDKATWDTLAGILN